ncbi:MAG: glycosyltransferase, partial [Candidatus Kapaibacterium sp.]
MPIIVDRKPTDPTLGACIIVKNAEYSLAQTLRSVRGVVDQVVVVDTGSTDETPRVATRMGAEVFFHPWSDDFSAARNAALGHMRTDRVLVIDADERLDEESRRGLRSLPDDASVGGYRVRIISALSETSDQVAEHRYPRVFRRRDDIRFRGAIHEQISEAILEAGLDIVDTDIVIHHEGYRRVDRAKIDRNRKLLDAQQDRMPNDEWTAYHRGMTAFSAGDHAATMEIMRPLMTSLLLAVDQREFAILRYAQSALATDTPHEAIAVLATPMNDIHREGLRQFVLGAAYASTHTFDRALQHLEEASSTFSTLIDQSAIRAYIDALRGLT